MHLYGALASPYVARVALFARLKGIELPVEPPPGGHIKSPEYLALNPLGKMPTLVVEGIALPESEVICEFLEDLGGGRSGLPGTPLHRARARLITRVYDLYVAQHGSVLFRKSNPEKRDQAAVDAAIAAITTGFGHLEHFIEAEPFAAGPDQSLADAALVPAFALLKRTALPLFGIEDPTDGRGKLGRWWQAVTADPLCTAFLEDYAVAVDGFLKMLAGRK
jgi:glutathione S-transferase